MARDTPPLDGLDLNLLVTLRALLREASVTRAAELLGQRQPTVSRALATLRAAFGDELLVRSGRTMALTPLALSLRTPVERALAAIDQLRTVGTFDPATDRRTFRVVIPDVLGILLLPDLMVRLTAEAPGVGLHVASSERDALQALLDDEVDLVVGAPVLDHPELYARSAGPPMPWSVLCGPLHPRFGTALDTESWRASSHLQVTPHGRPEVEGTVDRWLSEHGWSRDVRLHVGFIAALAPTLLATPLVSSLPTPVAERIALGTTLSVTPHPLSDALGPLGIRLTWHRAHHTDEGHRWLRGVVVALLDAAAC